MNGPQTDFFNSMAMTRPQVGIERLPARRMSNEPRESMNCKSCRKRKIKCNRLRPTCEACQIFQCPCVYDAVPKKRGPKTDVLDALLKRVDGLEAKLREKNGPRSPSTDESAHASTENAQDTGAEPSGHTEQAPSQPAADQASLHQDERWSPQLSSGPSSATTDPGMLIDVYFARCHAKPFHILDETYFRHRLQRNQLHPFLMHAVCATAARYVHHPQGHKAATDLGDDYATRSRQALDTDEPSVDVLQALLLLVICWTAGGKGKKAYMLLTTAVGMAILLETHREMDDRAVVSPTERETRRKLFWTCYLLDKFMACGSKRPSLLGDKMIQLRLPSWASTPSALPLEGEFFQAASNLQHMQGSGRKPQGSAGMLIDITRILGITNRYLAAGGVKGDSHFPWHSLSNLSKIRQDLDVWASGTDDVFSSLDKLFGHAESTSLVLSKLTYHLIHCLIYRPFLPIDLSELAGTGQHQSWQIEATHMCFLHANAISELVELGRQAGTVEWPALVGFCICTAATVHIHGAHYSTVSNGEVNVFRSSSDFLSRELQQLSELWYAWASVQHQRATLLGIYNAHAELVKSLADNPTRHLPSFHLEDFFDRYAYIRGGNVRQFSFDMADWTSCDDTIDPAAGPHAGHPIYAVEASHPDVAQRPNLKRRNTSSSVPRMRPSMDIAVAAPPALGSSISVSARSSFPQSALNMPRLSGSEPFSPSNTMATSSEPPGYRQHISTMNGRFNDTPAQASTALAGFSLDTRPPPPPGPPTQAQHHLHQQADLSAHTGAMLSPQHLDLSTPGAPGEPGDRSISYDPMFGSLPTNAFGSPAAWQGGNESNLAVVNGAVAADDAMTDPTTTSPRDKASNGSSGSGAGGEEIDPFLSLLEQLAENEEQFSGFAGGGLDFFVGGGGGFAGAGSGS